MVLRLSEIALDVNDMERMATFWGGVLGADPTYDDDGDASLPVSPGVRLILLRVPEGKTAKNRLHLDLSPAPGDRDAEVERVLALGARHIHVGQPADATFVVLADPDGNEFCILSGA